MIKQAGLLTFLFSWFFAANVQADNLVVVELFSSQGCEKCPPANKLLIALAVLSVAASMLLTGLVGMFISDSFAELIGRITSTPILILIIVLLFRIGKSFRTPTATCWIVIGASALLASSKLIALVDVFIAALGGGGGP